VTAPHDDLLALTGDVREGFLPPHWVRRATRLAAVALLSAAAVVTGRMVGRMGQETGPVRTIAPAGSQVRPQAAATQMPPWPLAKPGAGRR
jgi:hypothetical protein